MGIMRARAMSVKIEVECLECGFINESYKCQEYENMSRHKCCSEWRVPKSHNSAWFTSNVTIAIAPNSVEAISLI